MPYKDSFKQKEYHRQWYLKNKEKILERSKELYHNNPILKKENSKRYRENNPEKIKERYKKKKLEDIKQVLIRRDKNNEEAILSKGGKCEICGFAYNGNNSACFDFHHLDSNSKKYNPSEALRLSKTKRDEELSKCILVCANCHRLIHAKRNEE